MTDLEISKSLALAIGWTMTNVLPNPLYPSQRQCWLWTGGKWRLFDYRDWSVIGPIAEKYDLFPYRTFELKWTTNEDFDVYDTPQKAIAMAVIGARK